MELSSGVKEWSSGVVEWSSGLVKWFGPPQNLVEFVEHFTIVDCSSGVVEWSSGEVEWRFYKNGGLYSIYQKVPKLPMSIFGGRFVSVWSPFL